MKKLKGILLTVVTVILAVAMLVGTATVSVFADTDSATPNYGASATAALVRKVNYGDSASKIEGAKEIISPSGKNILTETEPKFNEIGAYTVKFANGYSYVVSCTLDKEYELRVAHNGADIPTYLQAEGKINIPAAAMWYKSEKEYVDYEKDETQKVLCVIEGVNDDSPIEVSAKDYVQQEIQVKEAQTYTVHYYCTVNGGSKYIFKDYTVNVQKKFEDKSAPTLGLVNVPTNISLNTKVTLPKATATDNYDKNVKVEITVEEFDKDQNKYVPVKHVEPDEDGYGIAYSDEEYAELEDEVFENDYNLSFYPVHATKYKITYSAKDDAGNPVVSEHVYETTASDRTAPVLKNIDEDKIPTVWGLKSVKSEKNENVSTLLKFPTPEFVDNSRETPKVKFELRDTVNNNVVISFENINDKEGDGAKYKYSSSKPSAGLYPTEGENVITWESLVTGGTGGLDLTKYTELDSMKGKTVTGKYTVRYEARDSVPHTTSRTYNIDIQDEFSDTKAPLINDVKFDDKFIVFTKEETDFNIPVLEVSDDNDAKPTVEYKLYAADASGAAKTGDNSEIIVEGGETAKLELKEGVPTLTVDDDKVIKFDDTYNYLVYSIVATDDVGNEATLSNKKEDFKKEDLIAVVNGSNLAAPTLEFNGNGVVTTPSEPSTRATGFVTEMKEGVRTTVGGFAVTPDSTASAADKNREFYGFEISLYTVKDKNATNGDQTPELWTAGEVTLKTYWDDKNKVLHVDDITFAAPRVDQVIVFVRAYSVSGASTIAGKTINVTKKDSSGGTTSAIDWRNEGTVYTEYTIKNRELQKPEDINEDKNYIVREIVGNGKFALTGFRFSAYNAGSFTFSEYYNNDSGDLVLFNNGAKDTIVISETATPVWNLQDKMPTYVKLSTATEKNVVALPKLVASTEYANAKVELTATFKPAGSDTKVLTVAKTKDETGKDISINDDGQYTFEPKSDGTYTFKYSAFYGDNGSVDVEYVVKAGDVTPPDFDVQGKHATTATENDTFEFHAIKLGENEDGESKMTFTKTLKDPAGTAVYTVKGTGSSYASATKPTDGSKYTFTKTGNYTVEYSVKDQAGNETLYTETITVSAANVSSPISTKIISTILIIVGVLLIAGVILYFVRFRKVKSK
ncbi:MAG: hypothetical protein HFE36_03805 [Clostridia bacterium]|nr:hypothetical protein [Clostridia bacterium]